jgi:hypothetical protein
MSATKQRRYLIIICIFSLLFWVTGSFGLMFLWFHKGSLSAPTGRPVTLAEYQALLDWHKDMVFHIIPGIAAGYFLLAMFVIDLIVKTKPTNKSGNDA